MDLAVTAQELWTFGLQQRAGLGTPVVLVADVVNGVAETRYSALRAPGAGAGYTVTTGKTLWLTKLVLSASIINATWLLGSGTADAGDSQVAAPAGAVSEDSRADGVANCYVAQAALAVSEYNIAVSIATARLPFVRNLLNSSTLRVLVMGVEV